MSRSLDLFYARKAIKFIAKTCFKINLPMYLPTHKKKFGDSNSFVDPGKDQKMARMLLSHSAGQTFSGQGRNHFGNTLGPFRLTQSNKINI